ncbi:hypothetical protein BFP75_07190 [Maribacter sp. 4G9]|nr:hypothetical protein BFP75_07190 [Maribacter sp. 4G9]
MKETLLKAIRLNLTLTENTLINTQKSQTHFLLFRKLELINIFHNFIVQQTRIESDLCLILKL